MSLQKSDTIIMYFDSFGLTSKEEQIILEVTDDTIIVDDTVHPDGKDEEEYLTFDRKSGKCLNDNTFMGSKRRIDPI